MPVRRVSTQQGPERPAAYLSSGSPPRPRLTNRAQSSRQLLNQVFGALSLRIEYKPVESLKPARRNARIHSPKQIQKIAASLRQFGFVNPLLIGPDGEVYAGNGRLEAAKLAGIHEVPTIALAHLTDGRLVSLNGREGIVLVFDPAAQIVDQQIDFGGIKPGDLDRKI